MKAIDIFEKLMAKAFGLSMRFSSNPRRKSNGVPGELVKTLSKEERECLQDLRAEDLSEEKIPRGQLWLFPESESSYDERLFQEAKSDFEKRKNVKR